MTIGTRHYQAIIDLCIANFERSGMVLDLEKLRADAAQCEIQIIELINSGVEGKQRAIDFLTSLFEKHNIGNDAISVMQNPDVINGSAQEGAR